MPMTKQALFDKVATHLLTQRRRCTKAGQCSYRGPSGMSCAIGCLIPAQLYSSSMEGMGVRNVLMNHPTVAHLLGIRIHNVGLGAAVSKPRSTLDLLAALQGIHDCHTPDQWSCKLAELAEEYQLNTKVFALVDLKFRRAKAAKKAWQTRRRLERV